MDIIRRTLGGLFALMGMYYAVLSVRTLARLPSVTARWIQRSGDPDFKYDYQMFMLWIAVGAVLVGWIIMRDRDAARRPANSRMQPMSGL